MKKRKTYSKVYDYLGYQVDYPKILKYIKNNSIENPITGNLLKSEQDYMTLEKKVLIKITADIGKMKEKNKYKSTIIVEKVGPNAHKTSEIENTLLKEGFQRY